MAPHDSGFPQSVRDEIDRFLAKNHGGDERAAVHDPHHYDPAIFDLGRFGLGSASGLTSDGNDVRPGSDDTSGSSEIDFGGTGTASGVDVGGSGTASDPIDGSPYEVSNGNDVGFSGGEVPPSQQIDDGNYTVSDPPPANDQVSGVDDLTDYGGYAGPGDDPIIVH